MHAWHGSVLSLKQADHVAATAIGASSWHYHTPFAASPAGPPGLSRPVWYRQRDHCGKLVLWD